MVDGLRGLGHCVEVAEFWKDVRPAVRKFNPSDWIIFNWCEGVEDEIGGDARICADLDELGYTYTGNPPHTLKLSVEKGRVKRVLQRYAIPTPGGREFKRADEVTEANWDRANFPAIVKPVSQHCSVAVTRDAVVHDLESLRRRVAYVIETVKEPALAEKFIAGREINVGIWGNGRPRVLPLREIDFSRIENPLHQMVTWDSKWVPDSPEWNAMPVITQPSVSEALRQYIEEVALKTYRMFECRDYARVDLRVDANDQPYVVDVNPNPDITADGGFAGACYAEGYIYAEVISAIVAMAVARRNRREALFNTLNRLREREITARPVAVPA
jgi:D-alanine-D-alanine ligase